MKNINTITKTLLLFAMPLSNALAATIVVTTAADSGNGSLRDAVKNAATADVVIFNIPKSSTGYDAKSNKWKITLTNGEIEFDRSLTINGGGKIILDGNKKNRIFGDANRKNEDLSAIYKKANHLTLEGLVLQNGKADKHNKPYGGAVHASIISATKCTFIENSASEDCGGAIDASTITIKDCTFTGNTAKWGGAIDANGKDLVCSFTDCVFSNNKAELYGGAVNGSICETVKNSKFINNTAEFGGAMSVMGYINAIGCVFSGNTTTEPFLTAGIRVSFNNTEIVPGSGSALLVDGPIIAANCSFTGNNTGNSRSGAIHATDYVYLYHSTVADNNGKGIQIHSTDGSPILYAYNSIIVGNSKTPQIGYDKKNGVAAFFNIPKTTSILPNWYINGDCLVEGINDVTREKVFGNSRAINGIITPRLNSIAYKTATPLIESKIKVHSGMTKNILITELKKDITGASRYTTGDVNYGAKE
jgi:Chlamydia polymorphic membrane protein (Chlamydia_PMP).